MYGYVSINRQALSEEEVERYRAFYCGLCRALRLRCGQMSRLTLSYDMTVLFLLLSALYEPEGEAGRERCAPHMLRPHAYVFDECAAYAADMSVILAWHKAADDWQDERRLDKLAARRALAPAYARVKARWPEKCRLIDQAVEENARMEKESLPDIDAAANVTGRIMGEVYAWKEDFWGGHLRRLGHALGRFVYLMDAYDDLPGDRKAGRPNPLLAMSQKPDYEAEIQDILTLEMAEAGAQFERLPILRDANLLRNIFYSGVWCRYAALQKERNDRTQAQAGTKG
ncbi:MAG: hypothetical protein IJ048_14420 [Clostridia bacterium]|nr:hypothetical protein [Clostridia bacterium]